MKKQLIILFIFVIVFGLFGFFNNEIKNSFYSLSAQAQIGFDSWGRALAESTESFLRTGRLKREKQELEEEKERLQTKISELLIVEQENEALRQALDLGLKEEAELLFSKVVFKNREEDLILINKGEKDGVEKEMAVITAERVLVGRVSEVFRGYSQVQLISHLETSLAVESLEKECVAKAQGRGGLNLALNLIPRDKEIVSGDCLYTIGSDSNLPAGLLVGEVEASRRSDLTAYQEADLKPAFDLASLNYLFVVLDF